MIKDLMAALRFAYTGRVGPEFRVRRISTTQIGATDKARATVVVIFSYVMSGVLILSVIAEIVYPIMGKKPSEQLRIFGSMSLGYLGGVLGAFFGLKSPR